jgi:BioD-like phosphotransacetylase family protein
MGVILNRVKEEKREMITHYMKKALKKWNVPLLGCIPYDSFLSTPTMQDLEMLFETSLVTGEEHRLKHFANIRLVATSVDVFREMISPHQIIITPANREDIILATLTKHWEIKHSSPSEGLDVALILTGEHPPRHFIVEQLKKAHIPMLYTDVHSHVAMQKLSNYTAKIRKEDEEKIKEAIEVVESHIDFSGLLQLVENNSNL